MSRIEKLRGEIRALQQQIGELQSATLPPAEIREAVAAWLDDQAKAMGIAAFGELVTPGGLQTSLPFSADRLLLHLFRNEIQERLTKHLNAANAAPGLPAAKRQKEIAKLIERRRELEVQEELAILAAEDATGEAILRRPAADAELLADVWHEFLSDDGRIRTDEAA
jgi:hypothetical protein